MAKKAKKRGTTYAGGCSCRRTTIRAHQRLICRKASGKGKGKFCKASGKGR